MLRVQLASTHICTHLYALGHTCTHLTPTRTPTRTPYTHTSDASECRFRGCSGRYWSTASGWYLADQQPSLAQLSPALPREKLCRHQPSAISHQPSSAIRRGKPCRTMSISPVSSDGRLTRIGFGMILCRYHCTYTVQTCSIQSDNTIHTNTIHTPTVEKCDRHHSKLMRNVLT